MARQVQPILKGALKRDDKADPSWLILVWELPNGRRRLTAEKAVLVGKQAITGKELYQQRLVDVDGNPV